MGENDSTRRFFDPERPPHPGGWHYWFDPASKQFPISGRSAQEVFDHIRNYQKNNGHYAGDEPIWKELWRYWCSLEPNRCITPPSAPVKIELPGKEVWGPILWKMLNWAAVNYNPEFFRALVNEMRARLIVCPNCQAHFEEVLMRFPLEAVKDVRTACRFAFDTHQAVSLSLGKTGYTYMDASRDYGFPL